MACIGCDAGDDASPLAAADGAAGISMNCGTMRSSGGCRKAACEMRIGANDDEDEVDSEDEKDEDAAETDASERM